MEGFQVSFTLNPVFNVQAFNSILNGIRDSLGELGKNLNLKPIDEAKFNSALNSVKTQTEGVAQSFQKVNENAENAKETTKQLGNEGTKSANSLKQSFLNAFESLNSRTKDLLSTMLGVFGGGALLKGVSGLFGGFSDILSKGKSYIESMNNMKVAFAQAGKSGDELNRTIKETMTYASELANRFAIPTSEIRRFSQVAAAIGGATGKANQDLTTLAIAVEKTTNGLVSGELAIRLFSKGVTDPEAQFALGRLTKQFPALASALKDVKSPAEATQKALQFFGPALKQIEENADGPVGASVRLENALSRLKSSLGKVIVEAIAPFITSFTNNILPVLQSGASAFGSLINAIKPLQPILMGLGVAVAGVVTGLLVLQGIKVFTGLATSATQFGLSLLQKVIPALVAENAATGALVFQKEALTVATLKESAVTMANTAAKMALTGATTILTAAQTALNAAFIASPIGWVVVGIGALVGGMILLYKNVQAVRNFFDSLWAVIVKGATYAWEIIKKLFEIIFEIGKTIFNILITPFRMWWTTISAIGKAIGELIGGATSLGERGTFLSKIMNGLSEAFTTVMNVLNGVLSVVKSVTSAIDSFISGFGSAIGKLLSGDFKGFIDGLGKAGEDAGKAFTSKMTEELESANFELAGKKIKESIESQTQIQIQIDKQATLQNLIQSYEGIQNEIASLSQKSATIGLSDDEKKRLQELQTKSIETAKAITDIVPQAKGAMKTIVDETGRLQTVWDVNISKAKEFANTSSLFADSATAAKVFTNALGSQANAIENQKQRLNELKNQINQTTDPEEVQKLIAEYNKLSDTINQNKDALVQNFLAGAMAGNLTEEALQKVAKALGISTEEAKKMAIAKELEEANKQGKVTPELIQKIAGKYKESGSTVEQIYQAQKKVTRELEASKIEALGLADAVSLAQQKQKEGRDIIIKAIADLKAGRINQEEYNKRIAEGTQKQKEGAQLQQELNDAAKEATRQKLIQNIVADETAEKEKKTTGEVKNQIDKYLELYELKKKANENEITAFEKQIERQALLAGRTEKTAEEELLIISEKQKRNQEAYNELLSLVEKYKIKVSETGQISFAGKIKSDQAQKIYEEFTRLKNEIESNENSKIRIELKIKQDKAKLQEEIKKAREEIAKTMADMKLSDIEVKVKLGLVTESELTKAKIAKMREELQELQVQATSFNFATATPETLVKYNETIAAIQKLNQNILLETQNLNKQLENERINSIIDEAEKEREVAIAKAKEIYEQDLLYAKDDNQKKLQAYLKYLDAIEAANQSYLAKQKTFTKEFQDALFLSLQGFSQALFETSLDPLTERLEELRSQLQAIKNTKTGDELNKFKEEEKQLIESLHNREISTTDYYKKVNELERKRHELLMKNGQEEAEFSLRLKYGLTQGFTQMAKQWGLAADHTLDKIKSNYSKISILEDKLQKNLFKDAKEREEAEKGLVDLRKQNLDDLQTYAEEATAMSISSFVAMLASGASLMEAFKKGLLKNVLDIAEKSIMANIPEIYAKYFATLGPFAGPAAAGVAIGLIVSLLEAAKSAIGAYKGAVDIKGPGTETSDSIIARVSKGESIVTAKATKTGENKELLQWLNQTGRPAIEFYITQKPDVLKSLTTKLITQEKEITEKQKELIFQKLVYDNLEASRKIQQLGENLNKGIEELKNAIRNSGYVSKTYNQVSVDVDFNTREIIKKVNIEKNWRIKRL